MHRRYRQIARLIYRYCCVRYMKRINGKWVRWYDRGRDSQTECKGTEKGMETIFEGAE